MLDKFSRAAQSLKALAQEKGWQPDWDTFESLYDVAQTHLSRGDLTAAFRDLCRAMQTLLKAMNGQGGKTEVFAPRWDRDAHKHTPAPRPGNGHEPPAFRCENCGKVSPQAPGKVTPVCCERPMQRMP